MNASSSNVNIPKIAITLDKSSNNNTNQSLNINECLTDVEDLEESIKQPKINKCKLKIKIGKDDDGGITDLEDLEASDNEGTQQNIKTIDFKDIDVESHNFEEAVLTDSNESKENLNTQTQIQKTGKCFLNPIDESLNDGLTDAENFYTDSENSDDDPIKFPDIDVNLDDYQPDYIEEFNKMKSNDLQASNVSTLTFPIDDQKALTDLEFMSSDEKSACSSKAKSRRKKCKSQGCCRNESVKTKQTKSSTKMKKSYSQPITLHNYRSINIDSDEDDKEHHHFLKLSLRKKVQKKQGLVLTDTEDICIGSNFDARIRSNKLQRVKHFKGDSDNTEKQRYQTTYRQLSEPLYSTDDEELSSGAEEVDFSDIDLPAPTRILMLLHEDKTIMPTTKIFPLPDSTKFGINNSETDDGLTDTECFATNDDILDVESYTRAPTPDVRGYDGSCSVYEESRNNLSAKDVQEPLTDCEDLEHVNLLKEKQMKAKNDNLNVDSKNEQPLTDVEDLDGSNDHLEAKKHQRSRFGDNLTDIEGFDTDDENYNVEAKLIKHKKIPVYMYELEGNTLASVDTQGSSIKNHLRVHNYKSAKISSQSPNLTDVEDLQGSDNDDDDYDNVRPQAATPSDFDHHLEQQSSSKVRIENSGKVDLDSRRETMYLKGGCYVHTQTDVEDISDFDDFGVHVNPKTGFATFRKEWDVGKESPLQREPQISPKDAEQQAPRPNFVTYESVLLPNMPSYNPPQSPSYSQIDAMLEKMLFEVERQEKLFSLDLDILEPNDSYVNTLQLVPETDALIEIPIKKLPVYESTHELDVIEPETQESEEYLCDVELNNKIKIASSESLSSDPDHDYEPIEYNPLTHSYQRFDCYPEKHIWYEGTYRNLSIVPEEDENESLLSNNSNRNRTYSVSSNNPYSIYDSCTSQQETDSLDDSSSSYEDYDDRYKKSDGVVKAEVKLLVKTSERGKEVIEIRSVREFLETPSEKEETALPVKKKSHLTKKLNSLKSKFTNIVDRGKRNLNLGHLASESQEDLIAINEDKPSFTLQQLFVKTPEAENDSNLCQSKRFGSRTELMASSSDHFPLGNHESPIGDEEMIREISSIDLYANIPFFPCYNRSDLSQYGFKSFSAPHTNPFTETISNPFNSDDEIPRAYCDWLEDQSGGFSTTTERLVASNEEKLLDKPLGQTLTGLSVIDDHIVIDLETVLNQTNAFIQSESQPEPYDAFTEKYSKKEPVNERKIDDNKNNMNEKKKSKKGFFGSIKTFVERSFESDSESEKSPKKSRKPKKDTKAKKAKDEATLPPKKPKLPTPPLEPSDLDTIPYVESSPSDLAPVYRPLEQGDEPPPYNPPDIPSDPITEAEATETLELQPEQQSPKKKSKVKTKPVPEVQEIPQLKPEQKSPKKKPKIKTVVVEEVTKTIEPLVIEAEEFSIIVDPSNKESPKKSKETFTINIDESIEKIEKEILEKSPILPEEKIVKPWADLDLESDIPPVRPIRYKEHVYEDIEGGSVISIPSDQVKNITTDMIQNEINFGGWVDDKQKVIIDPKPAELIIQKHDKEVLREKEPDSKKKDDKKSDFFGLFKKKDSKKEEEIDRPALSDAVLKHIEDSKKFLKGEVEDYHDVRPAPISQECLAKTMSLDREKAPIQEKVKRTASLEREKKKDRELSPIPSGLFGIFKKSKKEDSKALILSQAVLKDMDDTKQFLKDEVDNYHDVKPLSPSHTDVKLEKHSTDLKESSPKPSGIFEIFKKGKKDEEVSKPVSSEAAVFDMENTKNFLSKEVDKYHDVKPEKFEAIESPPIEKVSDEARESSPKPSALFGIFKKTKKEDKALSKPVLSEAAINQINDTKNFLFQEVKKYHDVKPEKFEQIVEGPIKEEVTSPKHSSLFGIFKKTNKDREEIKSTLSEAVLKDMNDTKQFSGTEIEKHDDVKPIKFEPVLEATAVRTVEENKESSPKSAGLLGIFKISKKEEDKDRKFDLSEATMKQISDTCKFLSNEVEIYHDVKPSKFEPVETVIEKIDEDVQEAKTSGMFGIFKKSKKDEKAKSLDESVVKQIEDTDKFLPDDTTVEICEAVKGEIVQKSLNEKIEASPKHSGLFSIFKKSKKEDESNTTPLSEAVQKSIDETNEFLASEVAKYHDVKPITMEEITITKVVDDVESSSKPSRGLFGLLKKSKESPEKRTFSEQALKDINDAYQFIHDEVEHYEDVKPAKFEPIIEEKPLKATEEVQQASPKPTRGILGLFKKSSRESPEKKPSLPEPVLKDMDETVAQDQTVKEVAESREISKGVFGLFKKSREESPVKKIELSEGVQQDIADTNQFLVVEIENYNDVKPKVFMRLEGRPLESSPKPSRGLFGIFKRSKTEDGEEALHEALEEKVGKKLKDDLESSPKPARGLFGIFKKGTRDEDEDQQIEVKPSLSEVAIEEMNMTRQFLIDEIANYNDVKPAKFPTVIEEKSQSSPKPSHGLFDLFKKSKKDDEEPSQLSESVLKDMSDTHDFIKDEIDNYHDAKPTEGFFGLFKKSKKDEEELTKTQSIPADEAKLENEVVKYDEKVIEKETVGFLAKFKWRGKSGSQEPEFSEEAQQSFEDTKNFIYTELCHYDDGKMGKAKKEDKVVTFDDSVVERAKVKIVSEAQISVVDPLTHLTEDVKETAKDAVLTMKRIPEETEKYVKDKSGKDKKGFFNIFGKKSKSQDGSLEDPKGRSEDESDESPKKQKRRKSSSPFKIFEKSRKSDEDERNLPENKIKEAESIKDELLAVEFEHEEPSIGLSEEVLSSLDKKMQELKNYSKEAIKEMDDCRDFLFIELDNYDNGKPVLVTDIDKGLENGISPEDAAREIDDIIDMATRVAESTADISNKEMRKSGGFFNKIGNLISSTPEKTEEVKETLAEVADKAHDLNVDTKETLIGKKELLRHESDNVKDVTLDIITDLKQSTEEAATKTKESLEEAAAKANESTTQATAKTRNKAVDAVKGASEQIGDISDEVAEVIKYKSKKAKKKAGSFFSKMGNILTGTVDDVKKESKEIKEEATQALDETGENLEAAKIKAERVSQEIVEDIIKVVDETEKATRETLTGLEREGEDVMYDAEIEESEKVDDMKVTKDKAIDFAAEQLEGVKAAEVQIVESSVDKMEKLGKSFNKDIEVSAGVVKDKSKKTKRKSAGFFSKMGNLISGSADEIKKDHKDEEEVVSDKVDSATEVLNNLEKELKISIDDRDDVSKEDDGKKRLEEIEDKVFKVSKEVQDATAKNIEDIRGATSDFLQKTSESVQEHGTKLEREVSHVSSDAQKAAADSIESAKEKGKKAKKKSTGFLSKMGNLISGPGEEAKKEMKDFKESEKSIIQAVEKTVEKTDKPSEATKSKTETVKDDVQRTAKVATEELDKSAEVIDIVRADLDIMKEATDDKVDDVKETSDRCLEKAKDTSGSTIEQNKSDTITKDVTDKIVDDNDAIDSTKEERKKTKKKVGGFLSKVGNLISGAAEDTKKEFYDAQDTSVKAVDKKVEDISESLQATAEVAQDAAEDIIDKIKDTACNNPNEVTEHVKSTKKDMQGESEELITDIRGTAKDTADEILLGVQKIQEDIKEAVENLHATQDEAFHSKQGIIDQSSKKIQEPAKPLAEAAQGMIQEASDLSKDIKETAHYIGKKSANEFDKTKRNVDDVFSSIKDESEEALDKAKQKRKKSKKKSVGFFSKMGNLISGAAEDTKKELKDVEGANVKAVEGKVEQAKIVAEDSLTKLEEVNEAAKKKVCEVEEGTKEITADIARRTFKKADDIKEGVKDVMYKTENNLIEAKDTTLETVDTAKEKTKEMKDQAAKFVKDTKDITLQKTEAAIAATEEKTLEFTEKVLSCVEDGSKDTKGKAFEEIQIAKDQILDIKDQVLDVGHDVMTKTKDGLEAAGDKTAEVLTSAKDELTDVRDKLVENAEEKLEATEDFIVVLKDNISESRKTVGDQIGVVTEKVVDKTEEALDLTKKELLDLEDNSKETIIGGIEVTRDTIHKVVEESKGGLKETKKKVIDSSHEMMHNAEETIQLAKEALTDAKGQEALALAKDRLAELAESAGKKTSTLHSTKDTAYEETDSEIRLAQGTTSDVEVKIKEGVSLKREFSETAQNTFVDVEDKGKKGTENLVEDLKEKGKKAKKKSGGFFTKMGNLISGTAEDTKKEINELKESSERIVSEKMDDTKNMTDESKSCVKKALDDLDKETQIDKSASNKSGEEISRDKDWLATESAKIGDEKNETFDGANTAMYEASEGAKEKGKKYRKKSTGFLSKMGSLISGSTDEAKKNLNAAQHEIQKTLDTAVESENSLSVSASSGVKDEAAVFIKKETEQLDMTIDSAKKATKEALHDLDQSKDETFESTIKKIDDINETADKKIKELEKSKSQLVEGSLSKAEDLKGVEEVSKDKGKRARKRSTGFLSKVGNLIAGSTDEAKKDIKNTKDNLERDVKDSKKAVTEKIEDIDQAVKLKLDQVKCVTQSFIHQESIPSEAALSGAQQTVVHLGKEAKKVVEEVKEVSSNIVDKSRSQIESEDVKIETKISGVKESFGEVKEKEDTAKEKSGDVFPKPISSTKQDIKDLTKKVVDESIQKVEIDISELKTTTGETIKDSTSKKNEEVNREIADSASEVKSGAAKSVEVGKEKPKKVKEKSGGFFTKMGTLLSGAADESKKEIQKVETSAEKMISQESDKLKSDIVNITEKIEGESSKTVKSIQQQEVQVIEKDVKEGALEKVEPVAKQTSEEIKNVDESKKVASKSADDLLEKTSMRDLSSIEVVKSKAQKEFEDLDKEIDNAREQTQEALSNIYATREDLRYIEGDVKKGAKVKKESIKLTESSGKATNGVASQAEKLKSYVTSPTMARRAESQRYAKDERPTVREITSSKSEDFTDENLYTVTEPDDETVSDSGSKRKPLFHLESEEDDSLESVLQSEKDRRESAKSNVLETLTETKLDTLLSNLETQMVKDLKEALPDDKPKFETKVAQAEKELEDITKDSQADVEHIEQKLRDLDKALDSLEQASDPKLEKRLHRVERKFEHMASEVMEKDSNSEVSPNEVEYRREHEFQRLVSQLSTEEVSDFQKEYSHLWDETTFSKSEEWDSKTPDSQVDVQELPQGEIVYMGPVTLNKDNLVNKAGVEVEVIPIMKSPCPSPKPKKKNKRAKSAMDFFEDLTPKKEFDRGSLPDLKRSPGLLTSIVQKNPDRYLYGSSASLRSNASSTSELSKGEIVHAVLDWLEKSNQMTESSIDSSSIASSDSNLSGKPKRVVPAILVTKGETNKKRSKRRESAASTLTEETKTIPQPKPRFAKDFTAKVEETPSKTEKQISPVRDDLLDETEAQVPETYSDKKKFWENVSKETAAKRMSLHEISTTEKEATKKKTSIHEFSTPVPKPRSSVQISQSIDEVILASRDSKPDHENEEVEEDTRIMTEYQAQFQAPTERKNKTPPKIESNEDSTDSESDDAQRSANNENAGYISDSGDVEHYISDSEIEDRVPQIRDRQMSVFAPPVAAARKAIYERSASLPTEDLYQISASSIKLRKQYYEEQIKKEMIEEQLHSEIEEEPSPERKTLIDGSEQSIKDIAKAFDKVITQSSVDEVNDIKDFMEIVDKKEVSFKDDFPIMHKPDNSIFETQAPISPLYQEAHKEIDFETQTKRSSIGSSSGSEKRDGSMSKPDSMEVHVDKSEIEDSEKLAEFDQDATDIETKSLDSLKSMSPKSSNVSEEPIPEITVTLSGKQRRISEESDEYAPKQEKKPTEIDSPINVPEERVEDTVWEVVQSQPERFDEKVTSFDSVAAEKLETDDLSISTKDESDLGSEIHQDHSDSYASDKIKSESHSDIERIILDSLHQQKVDPNEAKAIATALVDEIETEISKRENFPVATSASDMSEYLKYLADTKGLDEREIELVESVLARRQRELAKLQRGDTQASSIEITDEDLRYSGAELDTSGHLLEQQISQLKAEKVDDIKSVAFLDKTDEKHSEETYRTKDYETHEESGITGHKSDIHTKSFDSYKNEKSETKDIIFEEDETVSESTAHEAEELEAKVAVIATASSHKKTDYSEIEEFRKSEVDVSKLEDKEITAKTSQIDTEGTIKVKTEDTVLKSDTTKSTIKHEMDISEITETDKLKLKGEIICDDYQIKEERAKTETMSEIKALDDGGTIEKAEKHEESHIKSMQKADVKESKTIEHEDEVLKHSKVSSTTTSVDVIHKSSSATEVKEKIEVYEIGDISQLPREIGQRITEKHEEIKRTSSSDSKSSIESGKSPDDQFSTCSSGRKGDSDTSRLVDKPEVTMRKTGALQKPDRKSGIDFETYSSSGESHYHSFELDSGKSRPCSSDVEGLVAAAGSSEYESALTSQDISTRSHITSTEYHTAVSSLSSKESMKSLDSESSGHLGSVEVSELSETLVPSSSDLEGDIIDQNLLEESGWNDDQAQELLDKELDKHSKMKRSHEMTFQPEPIIFSTESPLEENDKKFRSLDDGGSVISMSLSSTSNTTEPKTVIELSRTDSERGGSMTVSGTSDQLSIEGSCDSLVFHPTQSTTDMSTSTGPSDSNLQIESITFTTSIVNESGIRSVSTQVTSETQQSEGTKVETNGKAHTELKKKGHRRQESTSSFVPSAILSGFHSDLTESDKYTAELSFKEVTSDEKKDVDESYETEADQGFHRDVREGKYQEAEDEIKDDTPELSSEAQASVGELEQEYSSALARAQEIKKKSEFAEIHFHKEILEKRDSHGKSSSTSSEKSSFEEAEAEAAFNMVAHVSPAHKIKQICPILEDEDAEKHELETRERAQKEYEKHRAQVRDQSPGSIPDIKVTQHMTPLVDRNFRYPDLDLEEQERLKEKEKEKSTPQSTPQTPSSKSSEETDQGREYVLEDSGISIPEEPTTESRSTVIEQTVKEDGDKDTDSPNSDSFEMLEKPDLIDDFVVIEEVAKEAHEFDSEGKSLQIKAKPGQKKKKHDEEVEAYLTKSAPTPLTRMTDIKYYPDGSSSEELGFDFEDSPPINNAGTASSYDKELEANKQWIEQQFQGDQAARMAAGYDYEMDFERGPLEDIKEEDINDFDPTSSRIGSVGSQKESGGSLGSVKDSYSSTPDYDVLAGRKYFTRSGEHDDVSMSSLQEFENLERAMSLENRRAHQGSQDSSSNGSFKTRYYASKSGQGDDVSVSSLKEFEGLEMACIQVHKVETKAKEEEAILAQIDEGQESLASESESCETLSKSDKKLIPDSDEEDYEKRMFEIDEIIRQAQTNVERFIDLKEGDKTESLGRGDSIEEVSKVPDLDLDAPLIRSHVKVQWKENDDVMVTSTDSIEAKIDKDKDSHHDSTDSLDQKTGVEVMTASTDSIEFQSKKTESINLFSDSIEIRDEACGMVSSDSLELGAKSRDCMVESTDSLADPTSSTATHATYQYESDSVFSGSFTSGGSNTMVSSTDTIEPAQHVDIAVAARKVWFDENSERFTEFLHETGRPYVTEVIEPSENESFSHTIHRRVELPPDVRKVTFYGSDADEKLKQFIEDFGEGEHVEESEETDEAGNIHIKRVVQKRFIVKEDDGEMFKKSLASKSNQLTHDMTGEASGVASVSSHHESPLKAQASRRKQLRYEISVDDQIEVDPREHDWRFNLPEHVEGEEVASSQHHLATQQRQVADQHQLSEEMKQLLKELEQESKQ